jgi:two-component system sensor histidine kinase YesM
MGFQNKLLVTYSIIVIALVVTLGVFFYKQSSNEFEKNAYSNLTVLSDKMSQQLDNLVHPMDFITTELLSDDKIISALTSLATINRNIPINMSYIIEARQNIYLKLQTYSIDRNFYRVSFFNKMGDFLTSNFRIASENDGRNDMINKLNWIKKADDAKGKIVLVEPYNDPWVSSNGAKVFGLVRSVQWPRNGIGYVEVQNLYSKIQKIFEFPKDSGTRVLAVTSTGQVFYNSGITDPKLVKYYIQLTNKVQGTARQIRNEITRNDEIAVGATSAYTGIKIIIAQDKSVFMKPLVYDVKTTLLLGLIVIVLSFAYIYIFSRQLTKPIRKLKETIESTELKTLPDNIDITSTNNEIEALNRSFQHLFERLNVAVDREIKSQGLQLRASFDSLQAQVNPHFIYNILNVLSNKGIENGDEEICEICDSIAGMLRYSTSTQKRSATIKDEIEHVGNYLLLMKKRYEHKLEFEIEVDPNLFNEEIPKIVFQQITENSISHGFESGQKFVRVELKGYVKDDWWFVEISDNGMGFNENMLQKLRNRMRDLKGNLKSGGDNSGLQIGGMGLLNTYGRLALFYGDRFSFNIENLAAGGARVTIGSLRGLKEEEI